MSIAEQITALTTDKTNIRNAILNKGGTCPSDNGFDDFATDIGTIPTATPTQTKSMTLGSSAPSTVTPDSGYALSSVAPSIDTSVIKAENIAEGATILGVAGTHSGTSLPILPNPSAWGSNTFTLDQDYQVSGNSYTIPAGYILIVPAGRELNIISTFDIVGTLVNNGIVYGAQNKTSHFYIRGTFTNNSADAIAYLNDAYVSGTINNSGDISFNILLINDKYDLEFDAICNNTGYLEGSLTNYGTVNNSGHFKGNLYNYGTFSNTGNSRVTAYNNLYNFNGTVTGTYSGDRIINYGSPMAELPPTSEWSGNTFTLDKDYQATSFYEIPVGYTLVVPEDKSLKSYASFRIKGALQVVGQLHSYAPFHSYFRINAGGTISNSGSLHVYGLCENRGTIENTNDFCVNGELDNRGTYNEYGSTSHAYIKNSGTINIDIDGETGTDSVYNTGTINNAGYIGGEIINTEDGTVEGDGYYTLVRNLGGTVTASEVEELIEYQVVE